MLNGIDTSFWDGGAKADGSPALNTIDWDSYFKAGWYYAFIKVSEGLVIDPLFKLQWSAAKGRIYRSGYHFFRPDQDPINSAQKFAQYLDGAGSQGELPPVLDLEDRRGIDGKIVAERTLTWLGEYRRITGIYPIIYSRFYFLRDEIKTSLYPEFAQYSLWLASYYFEKLAEPGRSEKIKRVLTGQDSITFPIPPAPFADVPFFQWTALGKPEDVPGYYLGYGHKKAVDFNKTAGDLIWLKNKFRLGDLAGSIPPPSNTTDTITTPRPGVTMIKGRRPGGSQNVDFSLLLVDMTRVKRAMVTDSGGWLVRTSKVVSDYAAQIGMNGHAWSWRSTPPYIPESISVSDGRVIVNDKTTAPFLNITADNKISMPFDNYNGLYNAVGAFRYLVEGGIKKSYLSGNEVQYQERHARSCRGITKDGRLMLFVCDGTYTMQYGLKLGEVADILLQYGAQVAADNDSGGSSTLIMDGVMLNTPSDPEERAVINHLLLFFERETPMPETYYEYTATGNRAIRPGPGVDTGRIAKNSDLVSGTKAKGGAADDDRYTLTAADQSVKNGDAFAGDIWVKVYENDGIAVNGWTAFEHKGVRQLVANLITPIPTPDPDPVPGALDTIEMSLAPGSTVTGKDASGNVLWTHVA